MKIQLALAFIACLWLNSLNAQTDISQDFGEYRVYYSVFNSSFITPEIASTYGLTRADDRAIVNISLIKTSPQGDSLGLPAKVSGQIQNLIMQSTPLRFVEINEGDAVYYLASFRFEDQDPLHFKIELSHEASGQPYQVEFTRTLYHD